MLRAPQRLIKSLVSKGILQDAGKLRWRCAPELVDTAFRDAVSRKELTQLLYAVRRVVPVPLRFGQEVYENADDLARGLRYALFGGEEETFLRLVKGRGFRTANGRPRRRRVRSSGRSGKSPLFSGAVRTAVNMLAGFYLGRAAVFCVRASHAAFLSARRAAKISGVFLPHLPRRHRGGSPGRREAVEEARARFGELPSPLPGELLAWAGSFAALRILTEEGSAAAAAARYEQWLWKNFSRREKSPLPFLFALFYPLARIACGDRASLGRAYDYGVALPGGVPATFLSQAPSFIAAVTAAFFLRPPSLSLPRSRGVRQGGESRGTAASLAWRRRARRMEKERVREGDLHPIEACLCSPSAPPGPEWAFPRCFLAFLRGWRKKALRLRLCVARGRCAAALRALGSTDRWRACRRWKKVSRLVRLWKRRSSWEMALSGLEQVGAPGGRESERRRVRNVRRPSASRGI